MDEDLKPLVLKLLSRMEEMSADISSLKTGQSIIVARLDGIDKRLDDQGRILAALIPTRIAAVPPAAE